LAFIIPVTYTKCVRVLKLTLICIVCLIGLIFVSSAFADSVSGTVGTNTGGYGDSTFIPAVGVVVYADANNNKTKDSGEVSAATNSDGTYTIDPLPAGTYRVRIVTSTNYSCVQAEEHCYNWQITATDGGSLVNDNYILHQFRASATAQGTAFNDANHNSTKDKGEAASSGVTVFQDVNGNSSLDTGEPTVVTAKDGSWSLPVAPGHAQILLAGAATSTDLGYPRLLSGLGSATSITSGGFGHCAVLADHTVKCWGLNDSGQLGNGQTADPTASLVTTPQTVSGISDSVQVSAGDGFACSLSSGGTVSCWGKNDSGQVGDGTTDTSNTPIIVNGIADVAQIAATSSVACALLQDSSVWCWGGNGNGLVTANGSGDADPHGAPVQINGLPDDVSSIAMSDTGVCALTNNKQVWCWGAAQVAGDGDVGQSFYAPTQISEISDATQVVVGQGAACALISGGTVKCWGDNGQGQLGDGTSEARYTPGLVPGLSGITALMSGDYNQGAFCAKLASTDWKCWGNGDQLQFGAIAYTASQNLLPNSYSLGWKTSPVIVPNLKGASILGMSPLDTCAKVSGNIQCNGILDGLWWGASSGQSFSDGSTTTVSPIAVGKTFVSPSITTKPAAVTGATSVRLSSSFKSGSAAFCKLDDSSWHGISYDSVNCADYSASGLASGQHTFTIIQADLSSGIVYSKPVSYTWTIDATPPPAPTITSKPSEITNSSAAGISFSGLVGSTFSCKVDDGSWAACASPLYLAGLADGSHTVQVKQVNKFGITSTATADVSWTQGTQLTSSPTTVAYLNDKLTCTNSSSVAKGQTKKLVWISSGSVLGSASSLSLTTAMWGKDIFCVAVIVNGATTIALPSDAWNQALPSPVLVSGASATRPAKTKPGVVCKAGTWKYSSTFAYQWTRDGANITGASSATYNLTADDTGKTIACKITATNASGSTVSTQTIKQ